MMLVNRRGPAHERLKQGLDMRRIDQILASNYVGYTLKRVVMRGGYV